MSAMRERLVPIAQPPNPFYVVVPATTAYELSLTPDGRLRVLTPEPEPVAVMVVWLQWREYGDKPVGAVGVIGEHDGWELWHIEPF